MSFLNQVELVVCNGTIFVSEPEWTRVRPSLRKSIIVYFISNSQVLSRSGNVCVVNTDFLVWMEL